MDQEWHRLLRQAAESGEHRSDRTGVGTRAIFGALARFDLREGFPACTTKRLAFGQVAAELAAFLRGAETLEEFHAVGCSLWDGNAGAWRGRRFEGDVGRIYGVQWRRWRSWMGHPANRLDEDPDDWRTVDQLAVLLKGLRSDPHGRRHLVTTWNPGELDQMCLPPCHVMFQCFASDLAPREGTRGWLDLHFHMRSLDLFLGMPFDVASYALLCHLIGREVGRAPRYLVMTVGDAHVYNNHLLQVEMVLSRVAFSPARLVLEPGTLLDFHPHHARLEMYSHHPAVPAPLNV